MKNLSRRLLVAAALALLAAPSVTLAAGGPGGPVKGFMDVDSITGNSKDNHHQHWFDISRHDISIDDGSPAQCVVTVDVYALEEAPVFVQRLGEIIPQVKIELATPNFGYQYRAILHDAVIAHVNTDSVVGSQTEKVELHPASLEILTKEVKPDGTVAPGRSVHVDCASFRHP